MNTGHCSSTLKMASVCFFSAFQLNANGLHQCNPYSSSVLILHQAVINESCFITRFLFSASVRFRCLHQKLRLKRTSAGRRILSTICLSLFEVIHSMIVLFASQVLDQSFSGRSTRSTVKDATVSEERNFGGHLPWSAHRCVKV